MSRKKGFVIVVQQLYKWKYLPVAKVLFCDCQRFADMLRNKSARAQMELMRSFWSATWLHVVDRIVADQPVSLVQRRSQSFCLKRNWGLGTSLYMSFHSRKTYLIAKWLRNPVNIKEANKQVKIYVDPAHILFHYIITMFLLVSCMSKHNHLLYFARFCAGSTPK